MLIVDHLIVDAKRLLSYPYIATIPNHECEDCARPTLLLLCCQQRHLSLLRMFPFVQRCKLLSQFLRSDAPVVCLMQHAAHHFPGTISRALNTSCSHVILSCRRASSYLLPPVFLLITPQIPDSDGVRSFALKRYLTDHVLRKLTVTFNRLAWRNVNTDE